MKNRITALLTTCVAALILLVSTATAQDSTSVHHPVADTADVSTIDAIIRASYDVISGPADEARDWDRERSLFHPQSRHIPTQANEVGGSTPTVMHVDDFIARSAPFFEKNGFFEREIAREVHRFGDIAHVFSTYEWTLGEGGPIGGRGINSFQLVYDGNRWWIVTVLWAQESVDNPIPSAYLPAKD